MGKGGVGGTPGPKPQRKERSPWNPFFAKDGVVLMSPAPLQAGTRPQGGGAHKKEEGGTTQGGREEGRPEAFLTRVSLLSFSEPP